MRHEFEKTGNFEIATSENDTPEEIRTSGLLLRRQMPQNTVVFLILQEDATTISAISGDRYSISRLSI
jgi:hypothetical protein